MRKLEWGMRKREAEKLRSWEAEKLKAQSDRTMVV
jgi:hypothetical protein